VFVTTLLNPKALIFAFAIIPPPLAIAVGPWLLGFSVLVALVGAFWIFLGGAFARSNGAQLAPPLMRVRPLPFSQFWRRAHRLCDRRHILIIANGFLLPRTSALRQERGAPLRGANVARIKIAGRAAKRRPFGVPANRSYRRESF